MGQEALLQIQGCSESLIEVRFSQVLPANTGNLTEFSIDPNISTPPTPEQESPMAALWSETASLSSEIRPTEPPALLSVHQLCARLGVSPDWVYERTKPDAPDPLPAVRLGTRLRFDPDQVSAISAVASITG
jgi:hypothetical protein